MRGLWRAERPEAAVAPDDNAETDCGRAVDKLEVGCDLPAGQMPLLIGFFLESQVSAEFAVAFVAAEPAESVDEEEFEESELMDDEELVRGAVLRGPWRNILPPMSSWLIGVPADWPPLLGIELFHPDREG